MKANTTDAAVSKMFSQIHEMIEDNLIMILSVLHDEFGFGDKRTRQLILAVQERTAKYTEMAFDEILEYKVAEDRRKLHNEVREILRINALEWMPEDVYAYFFKCRLPTYADVKRNHNARIKATERKQRVSLKQAAELQEQLQIARSWATNNTGYNAAVGKIKEESVT